MSDDIILSARKERFKTRAHAEKATPSGYVIVQDEDGLFYGKKTASVDVVCPECGESHFRTTEQYDPQKFAHPAMIDLKEPYQSWGWDRPPKDPTAGYGCLVCPGCGAALAPNGKLKTR